MPQKPHSTQEILERCIVENSSAAWEAFFVEYASVVRRVYHAHAEAPGFQEFETWFPGGFITSGNFMLPTGRYRQRSTPGNA
jgi:hypothetical protein